MDLIEHANTLLAAEKQGVPVDWKTAYINLVTDLQRQAAEAEAAAEEPLTPPEPMAPAAPPLAPAPLPMPPS